MPDKQILDKYFNCAQKFKALTVTESHMVSPRESHDKFTRVLDEPNNDNQVKD